MAPAIHEIRAAFATIANNSKESHTQEFALEWFRKVSELLENDPYLAARDEVSKALEHSEVWPCEHCAAENPNYLKGKADSDDKR